MTFAFTTFIAVSFAGGACLNAIVLYSVFKVRKELDSRIIGVQRAVYASLEETLDALSFVHKSIKNDSPVVDYADDSEIDVLVDDDWDEIVNGCLCYAHYLCDGDTCGCKEYKCSCWQPHYGMVDIA